MNPLYTVLMTLELVVPKLFKFKKKSICVSVYLWIRVNQNHMVQGLIVFGKYLDCKLD
jgi:hypothetical protein